VLPKNKLDLDYTGIPQSTARASQGRISLIEPINIYKRLMERKSIKK